MPLPFPVPYFHIFGCMVQKFKQRAYAVEKLGLKEPA